MKSIIVAAAVLVMGVASVPTNAYAIGCVSGAAVGGVAGHYAGRHGLLGAAAGCAVGHHEAVMNKRRAAVATQPAPGTTPANQ